ncbi:MAG TPA: S9 family peptidase [Steroidobacteraceae bacterium]|nr:S9 family peptidase [Steroidobacteraceae bacterium]
MAPRSVYPFILCVTALMAGGPLPRAQDAKPFDAAAAFGARVDIEGLRLSPDGTSLAFVRPIAGQGGAVYTQSLAPGAQAKVAFYANGKPMRMNGCNWVSNDRLICGVYGLIHGKAGLTLAGLLPVSRLTAVNADGTKPLPLETPQRPNTYGFALTDATVIDWLPDQDGSVLMARLHVAAAHPNTKIGIEDRAGLGVDIVDTRTGVAKPVIEPRFSARDYISDGRGTVRIVAEASRLAGDADQGVTAYLYRMQGSEDWHELSRYNATDKTGFRPVAVDHDLNVAYGWKKLDGRFALYAANLDGSNQVKLVYAHPDVDLDSLVRIGRRNRVVGVSYTTDKKVTEFFDPVIKQVVAELHQALPKLPLISIVDSSVDENRLLVYASSDNYPGTYYLLDRQARTLRKFFGTRAPLEAVTLARVKAITYPAADGQMIPAYLTLPPGVDNPHGLPAIVMPHGGPSARDTWGFDWLAQFYAARGYAVLQPEFRGSSGFGDTWFLNNGFKSWDIAIGDVVSAGHWLVNSGIADASKLGIVGWSYGGYAALQSTVVDPTVFKAIVAIAPVTDLSAVVSERGFWSDYFQVAEFVGGGQHMRDGSPINHADKFKQPVLLFHGTSDRNVSVDESRRMAQALKAAGAQCDLVTYEDDDHQLEDSEVRADMLRKSDAFLRHTFGMSP